MHAFKFSMYSLMEVYVHKNCIADANLSAYIFLFLFSVYLFHYSASLQLQFGFTWKNVRWSLFHLFPLTLSKILQSLKKKKKKKNGCNDESFGKYSLRFSMQFYLQTETDDSPYFFCFFDISIRRQTNFMEILIRFYFCLRHTVKGKILIQRLTCTVYLFFRPSHPEQTPNRYRIKGQKSSDV